MHPHWKKLTVFVASISFISPSLLADDNYFKYKDKDGHIVISNTLPPEIANQGYQIINTVGTVVQEVMPRKSELELIQEAEAQKKQAEQERQAQIARQQAELQVHRDEILLESFNNESDIERAKNDKLASIEVLEKIIQENMTGIQKQLIDAKAAALNYQKNNQVIPENVQRTITQSERQIKENQAFLARKKIEKQEIRVKYQKLIDRFKELQANKTAPLSTGEEIPTTVGSSPTTSTLKP